MSTPADRQVTDLATAVAMDRCDLVLGVLRGAGGPARARRPPRRVPRARVKPELLHLGAMLNLAATVTGSPLSERAVLTQATEQGFTVRDERSCGGVIALLASETDPAPLALLKEFPTAAARRPTGYRLYIAQALPGVED